MKTAQQILIENEERIERDFLAARAAELAAIEAKFESD